MKTIEFTTNNPDSASVISTWKMAGKPAYQDLILKPEYAKRQLRLPAGTTWLRVLPAVRGSRYGWMLGIHTLQYPGGRHAHGKSIAPGSTSVFDVAYTWLRQHKPESLFSRSNRGGFRLLTDRTTACWVLMEENGKLVARILLANGYDGSRGGSVGLGHQLLQLVDERDVKLGKVSDPLDPESGVQICVEKAKAAGAKFATYKVRLGQQPAPLHRYIEAMDQSETDAVCAIENTVRVVADDEEWELLAKVIGPELRDEIRAATPQRQPTAP